MSNALKVVCLALGLAAFILLAIFGFAIWVFIPILPAGIIFLAAVITLKRNTAKPKPVEEEQDSRKAA